MRIGVVGLGFMGATHLRAWQAIDGVELAAVASSDEAKLAGDLSSVAGNLERGGEKMDFGEAARYRTAEELIADPSVDAVDLCTPTYLHPEQATTALEAGKHVLVEKPMALTDAACREMLAVAKSSGKVLMVAHVLRFWPEYAAALSLVKGGSLGKLLSVQLRRRCAAPAWSPWLRDKTKSGGAVLDLLIHDFDYCRQLLGMPQSVEATGAEDPAKGVDVTEARLSYGSEGPQVVVSGGWHHPESYPFEMELTVVSEGGTLDFRSGGRPLTLYRADGRSELVAVSETDAFEAELTAFAKACGTGTSAAICPPEESADAAAIARAADLSRGRGGQETTLGGGS